MIYTTKYDRMTLLKLMRFYELYHNINIYIAMYGDGSGRLYDCKTSSWLNSYFRGKTFNNIAELRQIFKCDTKTSFLTALQDYNTLLKNRHVVIIFSDGSGYIHTTDATFKLLGGYKTRFKTRNEFLNIIVP